MNANLALVLSPPPMPNEDEKGPEEWRGQHQGFSREGYEYCPILPWYNEVVTRMHEAAAAGTNVVNLSCTHPRGYIPNQILRRKEIREALKGWYVDTTKSIPAPAPDHWFMPRGSKDLEYCDLDPFLKEIERREKEATAAAAASRQAGRQTIPLVDLTSWHERGGIPATIMNRLERRKSKTWREDVMKEIDRLTGEANKAEAFAKTQEERAAAFKDDGKDPSALAAGAQELKARAAQFRENAKWLKKEIGDARGP